MKGGEILPDISMCQYEKCEKTRECFRFMTTPSSYQSYIQGMEKICNEKNDYQYFLEIKG